MDAMPQVAALSQITQAAPAVAAMLDNGPVLLTSKAQRYGVLVSIDEWNKMAESKSRFNDLEEIIELLKLELDARDAGQGGNVPADIAELERMAGRVPA